MVVVAGSRYASVVYAWSLLIGICLALPGCGSGGGGVDLASGQGPDPVILDVPIAYVKRPLPRDAQMILLPDDARELITFNIGADLYVRDRAAPAAAERNITAAITQDLGDVRDLEASYDGTKIVFAMRATFIAGAQEEDQPTWNIWEYDIPNDTLVRIIASDITAETGHDVAPHYLPDGRIIFSSTRQRQSGAILLDEGKPQFPALDEDRNEMGFVLHVMDADGANLHQVSFNQSHDLDPTVRSDGKIIFSRWDNMGGRNAIHLYAMNPDGTGLELL
jgi:Tol biopolymer transport system component